MALDTTHPELEAEQAYVDRAYACLELMRADVAKMKYHGSNEVEQDAWDLFQRTRLAALSDTSSTLVFGRIDERSGDTWYIGRHHVRDAAHEPLVVDWRTPVAKAFYRASLRDPMDLRMRRNFLTEGREVLGIADDDLSSDGVRAEDVLQAELERRTGGPMRDVVATIQAEQDVIIRAPLEGVVVVQGGPGTGKTVVGLHRAAYLLYEHRERLGRMGVLVVGPNPVFIRYVSQVLPSLGESAVTQVPVDGLAPVTRMVAEPDQQVLRLKGDARMASVIAAALRSRSGELDGDVELSVESVRFTLPADFVHEQAATLRERGAFHATGRERLRDAMLVEAHRRYVATFPDDMPAAGFPKVASFVRRDPAFRKALDRVWPSLTAERLVADLFASADRLRDAAPELSSDERRMLRRPKRSPWTVADGPLLDEAASRVDGPPPHYAHVVVDEAQDLSPMQVRMLARRCPAGSFTVLGDLGQATGVWAHGAWHEVTEHLPSPDGVRAEELTLGYRVSKSIADVSSRILAEAAPRLVAPRSVRREPGTVRFVREADVVAGSVRAAVGVLDEAKVAAVIVPDDLVDDVRTALGQAGVDAGHGDVDHRLTLVPVTQAKGLEFEGVVVVEPSLIVEREGLRMLYVAVTRAMRLLTVVHSGDLPSALGDDVPVAV